MGLEPPGIGVTALDGDPGASGAGVAAGASSYATAIASTSSAGDEDPGGFDDPLSAHGLELRGRGRGSGGAPKFPVNAELNAKVYVWRGAPWALEVDAVVNSTSESLDPALSSPGLHDEAGPGLAEECATLVRMRGRGAGMWLVAVHGNGRGEDDGRVRAPRQVSPSLPLPAAPSPLLAFPHPPHPLHSLTPPSPSARDPALPLTSPPPRPFPMSVDTRCIITEGGQGAGVLGSAWGKIMLKLENAAAVSHSSPFSFRPANFPTYVHPSALFPLFSLPHDNPLPPGSIALLPIYSEAKGYPREPAAHVAIRTVRRFLEKHGRGMAAVVFCIQTDDDHLIYKRLLPLYFPRDSSEEVAAQSLLPADVGDENGEIVIAERMIRISKMPCLPSSANSASTSSALIPAQPPGQLSLSSTFDDSLLDPAFISMAKDPDQRRVEQREHALASAQTGWIWLWARCLGLDLGDTVVSLLTAGEQLALHGRYLARAEKLDLTEVQDMRIM
ncbi:unnamed protein product [Closterium sp. Yama58-4]|nr:unnamed protein product [Closterium sp. Yama58-4]